MEIMIKRCRTVKMSKKNNHKVKMNKSTLMMETSLKYKALKQFMGFFQNLKF